MDASGPRDYRLLAELLADGLGFAPERRPADHGWAVGLRHCPFLEVVRTVGTTVCRAHLGLMQGAMAAMDAPVVVEGLEPFAEPDLCLTTLRGAT